jgi:TnpA family transposase
MSLPHDFSDEQMARDWTLSDDDKNIIVKYRKDFRTFVAAQLCALRLYGRFLGEPQNLSTRIVNYLNGQLDLPPSFSITVPLRKATYLEQRKNILEYLGFEKFDSTAQAILEEWIIQQATKGALPDELFEPAEAFLLSKRIILPGQSILERLVVAVCSKVHENIFESIYIQFSTELKQTINQLLEVPEGQQRSYFQLLKEYPPSAKISSIQNYLERYQTLENTGLNEVEEKLIDPAFQKYLFKLTKNYSSKHLKRFKDYKRYTMMVCFMLESRKTLLDYLVKMHDQYLMDLCRHSRNIHEKKYRGLRKRQKKAVDTILDVAHLLMDWPEETITKKDLWQKVEEEKLQVSMDDLYSFKQLAERGYGDLLLARYPSLRKYFSGFITLPFASGLGNNDLMTGIEIIRKLDSKVYNVLPKDAPTSFIPGELLSVLTDKAGKLNRNAWEMGLALAIKDALRSGDLHIPQSKLHVSFWDLMLNESKWSEVKKESFEELQQPQQNQAKASLIRQFNDSASKAQIKFNQDDFARIENGKLRLKRGDKALIPPSVSNLQKVIDASMPSIRIEKLLMEVDQLTGFTRHLVPISNYGSRPKNFYKTLIATLISQATNLGVMAMGASVNEISVDMLRHVLHSFIREDTLKAASAELVDHHHKLPLSAVHGSGTLSSSDAQRFKIRADSLLASYYPRYYGYYEKAIGIYTHVSDQYAVFNTKVISCSPREALYVLDGLLDNNTILKIKEHTTDTHGYTEILFALCHLLGFYFMPRIRDLKDQQLYRAEKDNNNYGEFAPLLNKTADMDIVEEQWEAMIRVAISLKKRTAPAHVIVQRLINNYPSDRLSKAFTNLGRIIKTEYILRYLTDPELRKMVQLQLNKGEYRHKLPRWIFFANQGEFTTGDYEEIMNKASCLSLVSNSILYWNTIKINDIVGSLRQQGEMIEEETLSHISFLPYKHVLPNGTYFIEDQ